MVAYVAKAGAHDLDLYLEELASEYFGRSVDGLVSVNWCDEIGLEGLLGLYRWGPKGGAEILLSLTLNRRSVPQYVVKGVLHHELCHWVLHNAYGGDDAGKDHDDRFLALDARYKHFQRCAAWLSRQGR